MIAKTNFQILELAHITDEKRKKKKRTQNKIIIIVIKRIVTLCRDPNTCRKRRRQSLEKRGWFGKTPSKDSFLQAHHQVSVLHPWLTRSYSMMTFCFFCVILLFFLLFLVHAFISSKIKEIISSLLFNGEPIKTHSN